MRRLTIFTTMQYSERMKTRKITETKYFHKAITNLIKKRQILQEDFDDFTRELAKNPEMGDVVVGTNGVRKARLKSASRGKSGGSRVCYYDLTLKNEVFLLLIYTKNQQETLTTDDKKDLKELVTIIRRGNQ